MCTYVCARMNFFIPLRSPWNFVRVPRFLMHCSPLGCGCAILANAELSQSLYRSSCSLCASCQSIDKTPMLSSHDSGSKRTKRALFVQAVSHLSAGPECSQREASLLWGQTALTYSRSSVCAGVGLWSLLGAPGIGQIIRRALTFVM